MVVKLPTFPECNHPVVRLLAHRSDRELLHLFQICPAKGQYFTAIFCRYSHLVYALIRNSAQSPVQVDYLFAKTWQCIYDELQHLKLDKQVSSSEQRALQSWILNMSAVSINEANLPPVETINYALSAAPPPLWCYLEEALEHLPATCRLILTLAQTFHWSESRIAAYLATEGEIISPEQVQVQLQEGYQLLEALLPKDIQEIYLSTAANEE